ncbi:transcriptional regulator [Sphaerisporangium siamense]|uniref:Transcriptional regulator with XRE-family HTH domain n=1 Tax=Sphaerisporangium siamense TaxID=795645 RepID=A0A7W7GAN1_9ACTN|nr:helix-turn-helix transcriptional regulator [Sphaerisporangium siamense]MBB4701950.1 transcriptional regulator with XRE-family HTH domain [Sphaerisporangium siamense]GII84137.1 transcriptional regulator [Sphaerisporangium siamense]
MRENSTILRIRLGAELRELRDRLGLSLDAACKALAESDQDISVSKLSRLENGKGAIRLQDIRALLDLYEVAGGAQRDALLRMAREAKAVAPAAWWTDYESILPSGLSTYVGMEAGAGRLLTFTLTLIDGLLQTEAYAHALIRAWAPADPPETIERLVELRVQRQKLLVAEPGLELVTIMDEAALRRPIGGAATMRAQLRHVADVCERLANVTVHVVPLCAGAYGPQHGMFTLIEPRNPADKPVAYVDSLGGNLYMQRPDQISRFRVMFDRLRAIALDPEDSLRVIRAVAEEMSS